MWLFSLTISADLPPAGLPQADISKIQNKLQKSIFLLQIILFGQNGASDDLPIYTVPHILLCEYYVRCSPLNIINRFNKMPANNKIATCVINTP